MEHEPLSKNFWDILQDFIPHLEELRRRLIVCGLFFLAFTALSWFFAKQILDFLTALLQSFHVLNLYFQKPFEAFVIHLKAAAFAGLILSLPVLFTQGWLFVAPGLYEKEKKIFLPLIFVSVALFVIGVFFAYAFVIPWGLGFLLGFETDTLKPMLTSGPYFSFITAMLFAFGVLFDFPLIVVALAAFGIVKIDTFARARRGIIVVIFIAAAILTPSPDPVCQLLLAIPLCLLFEISLLVGRFFEKKRQSPPVIDNSNTEVV